MARCLVTGHRGFIGSELFNELRSQGHDVMGIDIKDGDDLLEVLSEDKIDDKFLDFAPDYIFHLACIPRVAYSVENPVETMRNNVLAGSLVLNYAKRVNAARVIYSGSSSVIGNGQGPSSPYALQKLVTEIECRLYSELYAVDTITLRYFNVYSETKKDGNPYATAVAKWRHCISEGENPFITGDGHQSRDMAYLKDVVSANMFAMNYHKDFAGEVFDVGTGDNISLNEIKDIILKYHPNVQFDYVDPRAGDVITTKADMSRLGSLGWRPEMSIVDGINLCFKSS
ncbi:MAG: NAD-dependent epimerase/dehydratase family protein [Gammaproteobacteria bacterium]|nr:NAD-dependent epimerase/dehydratase family protein [Gammaproteobacteria bacterium]